MAVLAVDRTSGFNLLQAVVFEGNCRTVTTLSVFLDNFEREMNFESTENNAKVMHSKTPCDILATLDKEEHKKIKELYEETCRKFKTLSALHHCRNNEDAEMAVELVLHHGMDVDTPAVGNRTALLWTVLLSYNVLIQTLLDLGAQVNARREDKCTPLELAAEWRNYVAVSLLVGYGADVNSTNARGETALHRAVLFGGFDVTNLLIKSGCHINQQDNLGKTALHRACENKSANLVRLLLANGSDVSLQCLQNTKERIYLVRGKDRGKPAWHYVAVQKALIGLFNKKTKGGSLDVAKYGTLLASGWGKDPPESKRKQIAKTDYEITAETKDKTALHISCEVGDEQIMDLLVEHGADVNACDADGFTPLQIAAICGRINIVKKLVGLGADIDFTTADGKNAIEYAQLNEEMEIEQYLKSKRSLLKQLWKRLSGKHQ